MSLNRRRALKYLHACVFSHKPGYCEINKFFLALIFLYNLLSSRNNFHISSLLSILLLKILTSNFTSKLSKSCFIALKFPLCTKLVNLVLKTFDTRRNIDFYLLLLFGKKTFAVKSSSSPSKKDNNVEFSLNPTTQLLFEKIKTLFEQSENEREPRAMLSVDHRLQKMFWMQLSIVCIKWSRKSAHFSKCSEIWSAFKDVKWIRR